jgi:N-acetylglucosamine kinase-like BadF-type ATPase
MVRVDKKRTVGQRNGGVDGGGTRCRVACSYEYARRINVASDHARPKNVIPAGKMPRV